MIKRPLIPRLLGPEGPELGCEECFEYLDRYVEQALAPDRDFAVCPTCVSSGECLRQHHCLGMRAHLEGCPACAEEYTSLRALVEHTEAPPAPGAPG